MVRKRQAKCEFFSCTWKVWRAWICGSFPQTNWDMEGFYSCTLTNKLKAAAMLANPAHETLRPLVLRPLVHRWEPSCGTSVFYIVKVAVVKAGLTVYLGPSEGLSLSSLPSFFSTPVRPSSFCRVCEQQQGVHPPHFSSGEMLVTAALMGHKAQRQSHLPGLTELWVPGVCRWLSVSSQTSVWKNQPPTPVSAPHIGFWRDCLSTSPSAHYSSYSMPWWTPTFVSAKSFCFYSCGSNATGLYWNFVIS